MENILDLVLKDLKEKYEPHTIILYGSHARNEATEKSDIDIACFCDRPDECKDARLFHGVYLDAWIYPTFCLDSVSNEALRFSDGKVVYDSRNLGGNYLSKIKNKLADGKPRMLDADKAHLKEWVMKMLERANDKDLDGDYRRTWLQHDLLEIYFDIRGLWYLGSKKSFSYLRQHDQFTLSLFERTYKEPLNLDLLAALAKQVVSI